MKFQTLNDKKMFLLELGKIDLLSEVTNIWEPTPEMIELFISKRKEILPSIRDFRKSQNAKAGWRKNRAHIMSGIRKFHKSTKGKRFHRSLGTYLSTHEFYTEGIKLSENKYGILGIAEFLKAISSSITHMMIEAQYYMPMDEAIGYEIMLEDMILNLTSIINKVLKGLDLDLEDCEVVCVLIDPDTVMEELVKQNYNADNVKRIYESMIGDTETSLLSIYKKMFN